MMKKSLVLSLIVILSLCLFVGCAGDEKPLSLPNHDSVASIKIDMPNVRAVTITNGDKIENILATLSDNSKFYSEDSVDNKPINLSEYVMIDITQNDYSVTSLMLFSLKGKYYVEAENKNTWHLTNDAYARIVSYIK